eukprot:GHVQ01014894.1.p2 GENE.GHVQ01014894.1~~GHVQ01014894.1.p2  ORF type:complete len:127 (+),score=19.42 GHVQ01014894.1:266-646(+)
MSAAPVLSVSSTPATTPGVSALGGAGANVFPLARTNGKGGSSGGGLEVEEDSELKSEAMQQASIAAQNFDMEKDISRQIKTYFDAKYSSNWHCVVGKNFASYATYESKNFLFFYVGQLAVLLYKMG